MSTIKINLNELSEYDRYEITKAAKICIQQKVIQARLYREFAQIYKNEI